MNNKAEMLVCPHCDKRGFLIDFGYSKYKGQRRKRYACLNCGKTTIHPSVKKTPKLKARLEKRKHEKVF